MFGSKEEPAVATPPISQRLDSWKEIASYLRRDVRTVQRWEKQEGLPIHRIQHDTQGTVFAYKSEIDAWWRNHERHTGQTESTEHTVGEARWYTRLLGAASPAQLVVPIVVAIGMASVGIVALIW